jgi:hypothetical protein
MDVSSKIPRHRPSPNDSSHRWDEIGNYIISTVRFCDSIAEANGARYETLTYSIVDGEWRDGIQSETREQADVAHVAACALIRENIQ